MKRSRRNHSPAFEAKVALDSIRDAEQPPPYFRLNLVLEISPPFRFSSIGRDCVLRSNTSAAILPRRKPFVLPRL